MRAFAVVSAAAAQVRFWAPTAPHVQPMDVQLPAAVAAPLPQFVSVPAPAPEAATFPWTPFVALTGVVSALYVGGRVSSLRAAETRRVGRIQMAVAKPSKALPFLEAAACQSSGLPGAETGFDPLYFSDFLDIKWLREAELKHGRICMLAATGVMFPELFGGLPNYPGFTPNAVEAATSVPPEAMLQIVVFASLVEIYSNKGKFSMMTMFEDPAREPGNLGFDPLKFGENPATRERLEMAELKNGRLAMIAFSGMLHQTFVTGKPLFASLGDIFSAP